MVKLILEFARWRSGRVALERGRQGVFTAGLSPTQARLTRCRSVLFRLASAWFIVWRYEQKRPCLENCRAGRCGFAFCMRNHTTKSGSRDASHQHAAAACVAIGIAGISSHAEMDFLGDPHSSGRFGHLLPWDCTAGVLGGGSMDRRCEGRHPVSLA